MSTAASVRERETGVDPAYGFRQLVDIAERALSPGINDPTIAVQCIDRLHGLLRRIATRDLAVGDRVGDGVLRLRVPDASWADYVALACDEIRSANSSCSPPAAERRCRTRSGQPPWVRVTRASAPRRHGSRRAHGRAVRVVLRQMHERPVIGAQSPRNSTREAT